MVKLGLSIGLILLNISTMIWILGDTTTNQNKVKIAKEIMKGSLILIVLTLFLYVW
jgi:hypothetical protein